MDLTNFRQFRDTNYYVSQDGGVWCHKKRTKWSPERFTMRKPTPTSGGYVKLNLLGKSITVHKIVTEVFYGVRPKGMEVNHKNGVKTDNHPNNLEYVTKSRNMVHAYHELNSVELKGSNKLTEKIVKSIKRSKLGHKKLASKYGVNRSTIRDIRKGKIWKWVKP